MAITLQCTVAVAAPPQVVYDALTDFTAFAEWMPNFVRAEVEGPRPTQAGTLIRQTRKMFGRESTELFEVIAAEAPHRLHLRVDGSKGTTGKGQFDFEYAIEADGAGSRLTMTGRIDMPGLVAKLLGSLFAGMFRKALLKDLGRFSEYAARRSRT